MNLNAEKVMMHYTEAYQKLYNRPPKDLRALDDDWVIVNGARMRVSELDYLAKQLHLEYRQGIADRRTLVSRLITWFKR
jgi:hypothetical protein